MGGRFRPRPGKLHWGGDEQPEPDENGRKPPLPAIGCDVELTRVTIVRETWWTFGFESFGPLDTVENSLRMAAKETGRSTSADLLR
jgi:hypothetical protein